MVTFDSFADRATLDRPGFGESFFVGRRLPAIHVVSRENRWYQEPELPAALAATRAAAATFPRVVAYGSSMGGFAAIRFGATAGASTAIAISPQYTIDPRKAPFETRWAAHAHRIRFIHDLDRFPMIGRAYVFYDPRDRDARHADLIAAKCPTERIKLPYAGHPVGAFLSETGVLTEAVEAICEGRFDARSFERKARSRRRSSGQYLFALSHRVGVAHLDTKLTLARMAVAATPPDPAYRSFLALVLERLGRWSEAEEQYRSTVEPKADSPGYLEGFARALLRRGRIEEAADLVDRAVAMAPVGLRLARTSALVRLAEGRQLQGLRSMLGVLVQSKPVPLTRSVREVAAVYRWLLAGRPRPENVAGLAGQVIHLPFGPELAPIRRRR